jgi:hypothetical protein
MKVLARVEIEPGALFAIEPAEPGRGYQAHSEQSWDVYLLDEAKPDELARSAARLPGSACPTLDCSR